MVTPTPHSTRTDDVVGDERAVAHRADAGHDRRERAHDGHEAGQHDGLRRRTARRSVWAFTTFCGLKRRDFGPVEQRRADLLAEPVADLVARRMRPPRRRRRRAAAAAGGCRRRVEARKPAMNSSESPGRKNPMSRPGLGEHDGRQQQPARPARAASRGSGSRRRGGWRARRREAIAAPAPGTGHDAGPGARRPRAPLGSPRLWSVRRSWWRGTRGRRRRRQAGRLALGEGDGGDQHDQRDARRW